MKRNSSRGSSRSSPKGSSKGKGNGQRSGLSGNPQRRAEQLSGTREPDGTALRELAYRMAGGADPAPWWRESHELVLRHARAAAWPGRLVEIEDLTCRIVGGELYDCLRRHTEGHHQAQWLVALAEAAAAATRSSLSADAGGHPGPGSGSADWRGPWSLLRGIALIAPKTPDDTPNDTGLLARSYFPGIKDPYKTALAEAEKAAKLLADRGAAVPSPSAAGGCRAAGTPLVARDEYGSRFLLVAPFRYEDGEGDRGDGQDRAGGHDDAGGHDGDADHWYAWDIDACWIDAVVAAGTFASAAEALAEWRDAVGSPASGAALEACPPELTARLLTQSLETGPFSEFMRGDEPRELICEYYRQRRRAREVAVWLGDLPSGAAAFTVDMDGARDEFLTWHAARHGAGAAAPGMAEAVDTITDQWGPHKDVDDRVFYACSPHRVETAARLIRNGHYGEHAGPAIRLLPDWTQWCAERNGLTADAAARARRAAMTVTAALADASAAVPDGADPGPFRRPE